MIVLKQMYSLISFDPQLKISLIKGGGDCFQLGRLNTVPFLVREHCMPHSVSFLRKVNTHVFRMFSSWWLWPWGFWPRRFWSWGFWSRWRREWRFLGQYKTNPEDYSKREKTLHLRNQFPSPTITWEASKVSDHPIHLV